MKIGIISDSHENMPLIKKAVEIFNSHAVSLVLHAGDIISPITFKEFKELKCPMVATFGNNDGEKKLLREKFAGLCEFYSRTYETDLEGQKILLMHEPDLLDALTASQKYDVIIYGHTHKVDVRTVGKTLIINPGECGLWLTDKSTVAILHLPERRVEIINLI